MENEDLSKCVTILRAEPFFLFKKEDAARKLKCFETVKEHGTARMIWVLFGLLKNKNPLLREGAAETVGSLLEKTDSLALLYSSLKYVDFKSDDFEYFKAAFSPAIYLNLLFVGSLNQNGRVREKAVQELHLTGNRKALRFVILRLADWVNQVREAAENAVRSYFQPRFVDEFLNRIPLIEWLLKVERTDLHGIYSEIYRFIFSFEPDRQFYEKIERFGDKTKFIYVRNYLNSNPPRGEVFELLSNDKSFLVKIELLKHLEKLDRETQKHFIAKFLRDDSAKVRVYAIYSTKPFRAGFHDKIRESIFDVSASVRELARFILRESETDFAGLYRQRLTDDENSPGALLGLSEVGTAADLPIFLTYIARPRIKIKAACLTALNRLDKETARKCALEFLADSSAKLRNKSVEILSKLVDDEVLEAAREIYRTGDLARRQSMLKMFGRIGDWRVVGDFIIALGDANEKIRDLAWMNLQKWRSKQSFSKPRAEDLERAKRRYEEFDKAKPELPHRREKFWSELPFYLR
jgi:HEAT repeat protein